MGLMINSIKIITATILAVLTAQLLKLDFAISAGHCSYFILTVIFNELVDRIHIIQSIKFIDFMCPPSYNFSIIIFSTQINFY